MKIFKSIIYLSVLISNFSLFSMDATDNEIKEIKLDGKVFSFVTQEREIPTLQETCLYPVAHFVRSKIQHDHVYTKEKFEELLDCLKAHNIEPVRILALLQDELHEMPCEEYKKIDTEISKIYLMGNHVIRCEASDLFHKAEKAFYSTTDEKNKELYCGLIGSLFSLSSQGYCLGGVGIVSTDLFMFELRETHLKEKIHIKEEIYIHIKHNHHTKTCLAFMVDGLYAAIGSYNGNIDVLNLTECFNDNTSTPIKTLPQFHTAPISTIYFTSNDHMYSCDKDGNIFVWNKNLQQAKKLPINASVKNIISSNDGSLVVFEEENGNACILNWNKLTLLYKQLGKLIAVTRKNNILAQSGSFLKRYATNGQLLQEIPLGKSIELYGNQNPSCLPTIPLYIMKKENVTTKIVDDYVFESFWCGGGGGKYYKNGTKEEKKVETTLLLPKQLSAQELYDKLKALKQK